MTCERYKIKAKIKSKLNHIYLSTWARSQSSNYSPNFPSRNILIKASFLVQLNVWSMSDFKSFWRSIYAFCYYYDSWLNNKFGSSIVEELYLGIIGCGTDCKHRDRIYRSGTQNCGSLYLIILLTGNLVSLSIYSNFCSYIAPYLSRSLITSERRDGAFIAFKRRPCTFGFTFCCNKYFSNSMLLNWECYMTKSGFLPSLRAPASTSSFTMSSWQYLVANIRGLHPCEVLALRSEGQAFIMRRTCSVSPCSIHKKISCLQIDFVADIYNYNKIARF